MSTCDAPAVLFDMDGVLIDSEPHWQRFQEEFTFSKATAGRPENQEVTGMNYREIYTYLDDAYGTEIAAETFYARYETEAERLYTGAAEPMPGMPALLGTVRDADVPTGIVSASRRRWIGWVLKRFELEPLDLAMSTEEVAGPGKPAPDVYEDAATRIQRDPEDCLVIEDSRNGVQSAAAAGCHVIAFRGSHNADYDLSMADEEVASTKELHQRLVQLLPVLKSE